MGTNFTMEKGAFVIKKWPKSILLGTALAGTLSFSSFAFNLQNDFDEWSPDPDYMVTMYLGMPMVEFNNNFSGLHDWQCQANTYQNISTKTYKRIAPSSISNNIMQSELIHSLFRGGSNELVSCEVRWPYCTKKSNNNYKKEIDPAFEQARKMYNAALTNMVNKYGEPSKPGKLFKFIYPTGEIQSENISQQWETDNEYYVLYISLDYRKLDKVTKDSHDYLPVAVVSIQHMYKS